MRKLLIFLGTILISIIFPLLVVLVLAFTLWRQIVASLAIVFRPDFNGLVHHASAFWVTDLDRTPALANIGACLMLADQVTRDDLIQAVGRSLVPDPNTKSGTVPYPELTLYPVGWLGCSFWLRERKFDLKSHITEKSAPIHESELANITTSALSSDPWPSACSPWRMILYSTVLLPGKSDPVSAIILSFHHSLGDAEGIGQALKLINEPVHMSEPLPRVGISQGLALPYTIVSNYVTSYDTNKLHFSHATLSKSRHTVFLFKRINFGRSFTPNGVPVATYRTSIVLTGVAGGIRRYMRSKCWEIPESMHGFQPLFLPRDGIRFKNWGSLGFQRLYIGTENVLERLEKTVQYLQWHKASILPWTYHMSYKAIGVMPRSLQKVIVRSWQATGVYTEDHFPERDYTVCAKKARVYEFHNVAGPMPGTSGIFVYVSIFKEEVGLRLSVSEGICTQDELNSMFEDMVEEIKGIVVAKSV